MYAKARLLVGAAVVCTLFAGNIAAKDNLVTVAIHVSARGLDLTQPADARTLYKRLKNAAWVACTSASRIDLSPVDDLHGCYEKALGDAVHATRAQLVAQIYLVTHTPQEAARHGIEIPSHLAAH